MKLLWLPGWYPNKISPFTGDFLQRHAKAVALFHEIQLIYIIRDKYGVVTKSIKEENFHAGNLKEKIVYYYTPTLSISFIDKVVSFKQYIAVFKKVLRDHIKNDGIPALAHVQVVDRNGLAALWLKKKYKIPYCISEQWTIYLPEAVPNFRDLNILRRLGWKKMLKNALGISVVSRYLGEAIKANYKNATYTIIPNVVDENVFFHRQKTKNIYTNFIHISTLNYQKNPEMILQAFAIVKQNDQHFHFRIIGPEVKELKRLTTELGLDDQVQFYNEIEQHELNILMQQSDALVLYSRYETFGCVLIEANASGLPVIVSNIPVFHETIREGINGYFAEADNPKILAEKISWFIREGKEKSDPEKIIATTEKYHFYNVGKMFDAFYNKLLHH